MAEVFIVPGPREGGELVGRHISAQVVANPRLVLGVATGATPLPVYGALRDSADAGVSFSRVRAFALDEYVGLPAAHPESYLSVIDREVTGPLGLKPSLVHVPDGRIEGIETAGERYEAQLVAGGGVAGLGGGAFALRGSDLELGRSGGNPLRFRTGADAPPATGRNWGLTH